MQIFFLTLAILGAAVLLVTQWLRIELTALLLIVALYATGLVSPSQALSGLSNEATITVAAMLIISAGLTRTGALEYLARVSHRFDVRSSRQLIVVFGFIAAIASAFLNNTTVVILLIPIALRLCQRHNMLPSKIMIPLSYFSILGGTLTLIGTSTNILVDGIYRQSGGRGFDMFEFTPMGICYLVLGGTFLYLFADRILPRRQVLSQVLEPHQRRNFVTEIVVRGRRSTVIGKNVGDLLAGASDVRVLEIVRGEEVTLAPGAEFRIDRGDILLVEGSPRAIHRLLHKEGLDLASAVADDRRVKISRIDLQIVEAVVTPGSSFFNQRISDIGLNRLYGVKVLAVQRRGRHLQTRLRELKLRVGDVLLVQGEQSALQSLEGTGDVMLIEGVEKTLHFSRRAPIAVAVLAVVVVLAATTGLPLSMLALGGGTAMLVLRCLRIREAIAALDSGVLLLLAAAIPLGLAMQNTGLAEALARWVLSVAGNAGPWALIGALYLFTSVITAFVTNTATAALLAPIVIQIAADSGIDATPLLVAVMFGASASFFTPIGYHTNLLVMGPGGYRFRDYLRIGLILNLLLWIAATIMIPLFWPF